MGKNILYFTRTMGLGGTENVILKLCELMNKNNKVIVCSCGGINVEKLKEMGIKHYYIEDIENKNPKIIVRTLVTLLKIIKDENIDIVHTHHRMAAFYTSLLNKISKFIFIHTAHNTFFDKKKLTKFALKKANIIAVGNKVKDNLCNFYDIDKDKVQVIYNGVEENNGEFFKVNELYKYKEEGYFLVGNIGRISEQKGMEYFVKAIPEVLKKNKKVKFFIVGEGECREKIENIVNDLKIRKKITLLGNRSDVINIIRNLDLIVLSSLWEGLPLTPIEVFSQKKAIIATSVDGTPEIITDEYNGILIEPKRPDKISGAILKVINDMEFKEKIELNGYKTYKEKFSITIFNKNYSDYYRKIIKN